jgi:hypothetical protein
LLRPNHTAKRQNKRADTRATGDLNGFFNFEKSPREFHTIKAPLDADFFIHDTRPPEPPDTD